MMMMMSLHHVYSHGAIQSDLWGARLWIVVKRESTGSHWRLHVMLGPFFQSVFMFVFFKAFTTFIDNCSPFRSFLGYVFEIINIYAPWVETLLKGVLKAFLLITPPVLSEFQLTIENFLLESIIPHILITRSVHWNWSLMIIASTLIVFALLKMLMFKITHQWTFRIEQRQQMWNFST